MPNVEVHVAAALMPQVIKAAKEFGVKIVAVAKFDPVFEVPEDRLDAFKQQMSAIHPAVQTEQQPS